MGIADIIIGFVRATVGAAPRWVGSQPSLSQRVYFANHSSHIDTLAIWSALPAEVRSRTRPVAARDYWTKGVVRRYVATKTLHAVLIDRSRTNGENPLQPLIEALRSGDSLIFFPEGTRRKESLPGPFKSGLYHLATEFPEIDLVPVYLENLHRSMPKGTFVPIPLVCTVRFGAVLTRIPDEDKTAFLARARDAILELS